LQATLAIVRCDDNSSFLGGVFDYSVVRRSSGAASDFGTDPVVSDLIGSILLLSTFGVSTWVAISVCEPPTARSERDPRGRTTARAINICWPPPWLWKSH
jgi:hypothetical protein